MLEAHAVVWSEAGGPRFVGRLSVEDAGLHLRGASAEGELWDRVLGPDDIVRVRLVRPGLDDVDGTRSVVVEQRDGSCLSVVALDGAGRLLEIANLAAGLIGRARRRSTEVAVEVPIRHGHHDRVRELVRHGPPFDPVAVPELESHDVYVGRDHVIFIFRGENVADGVEKLLHRPAVWTAGADWRRSIAGRPSVLEHGYAWRRPANGLGS
jgi:hypothetical protein